MAACWALPIGALSPRPTGLIPQLDRTYFIAAFQLPPGSTLNRTDEVVRKAGRHHAHATGHRGGGRIRRLRWRHLHQRAQHRRDLRSPEVVRGARAAGPDQGRHPGRSAQQDGEIARGLRLRARAALRARHRHRRRPEGLRAGSRRPRPARAREGHLGGRRHRRTDARLHPGLHAVQHAHAADLRRHRPHQGRAAGRADLARVRNAVDLHGLGLRQRLSTSWAAPIASRRRPTTPTASPCATSPT